MVNGVSGYSKLDAYGAYAKTKTQTEDTTAKVTEAVKGISDVAAEYVKSPEAEAMGTVTSKKYEPNAALVDMLKADAEENQNRLMSYVQESILGQGNALASTDDMWKLLASGNFTVDAATKEEAKKSISEDGYWGVEKTSERILEMAKALTGGDPDKIEEMRNAFKKGFSEATKTWGKELPDISSRTYDAVMSKFDKWAEDSKAEQESVTGTI